jgi:hypothetical protein
VRSGPMLNNVTRKSLKSGKATEIVAYDISPKALEQWKRERIAEDGIDASSLVIASSKSPNLQRYPTCCNSVDRPSVRLKAHEGRMTLTTILGKSRSGRKRSSPCCQQQRKCARSTWMPRRACSLACPSFRRATLIRPCSLTRLVSLAHAG